MAEYLIGEIIQRLRKQKGISQDELAGAILDRGHLSRIESGKTMPSKMTIEMLFERLGYDPKAFVDFYVDKETAEIQVMMDELNGHLRERRVLEADILITKLEMHRVFKGNKLYKQYLLVAKASNAITKKEPDGVFDILLEAVKITIPTFNEVDIEKYLLTKTDIEIINMIAIMHKNNGDLDRAINLMYFLKRGFDSRYMDNASKGTHYPLAIFNLTKYLSLAKRYREAIELCDIGMKLCIDISALRLLPLIALNKAYCLHEIEDDDSCEKLLRQAYYTCEMYGMLSTRRKIKVYAKSKLDIDLGKCI
ncbi:MAG: helix-turn-helix transcriptional regulator [Defluviitaleaceae bacterium]|nr:helix-turn-helix transcriptional regulator [Defluviitaleaceae bacterium]